MLRLRVENFSCIEHADIEIGRLTVLIGPQASGKSVISKLTNFCIKILSNHINSIENLSTIGEYKRRIADEFSEWFPKSAWGNKKFKILFEAELFAVSFNCQSDVTDHSLDLEIEFSETFESNFSELAEQWKKTRAQFESEKEDAEKNFARELQAIWRFQSIAQRKLASDFGDEYIESQLFIPAGRAFFTSFGKSIALLEKGAALDPVTAQFGRLFSRLRDGPFSLLKLNLDSGTRDFSSNDKLMIKFFGGKLKFEKDRQYIESSDGRKVPFSTLSSGQQELLPLWLATTQLLGDEESSEIVYIEEPEAHLFPSAQASLTQYLVSLVAGEETKRRLFVTTHSPYVLATLNNFIKAGALSLRLPLEVQEQIGSIVPKEAWLKSNFVKAYAIKNGKVVGIVDEEGFIDTAYLDEISNDVSNTYSRLLELEYQN